MERGGNMEGDEKKGEMKGGMERDKRKGIEMDKSR